MVKGMVILIMLFSFFPALLPMPNRILPPLNIL